MKDIASRALSLWDLKDAVCEFVAGRENQVYRVSSDHGRFALRLRRPGYRSEAELLSETCWLSALFDAGLPVPQPVPTQAGKLLDHVDGHFVDLITWLEGVPLGSSGQPLALDNPEKVFQALGSRMAELHTLCDAWSPPSDFVRCAWDVEGLLGDAPLWGRFWDNPTLDAETAALLSRFRDRARHDLHVNAESLDYGLIHADLVRENVLLGQGGLCMIDFDDGGYGYRLFDLATALVKNLGEPDYPNLKAALLAGYRERRSLDTRLLDLFLAVRAATYVGWIVPRLHESGADERNTRFIARARQLCSEILDTSETV